MDFMGSLGYGYDQINVSSPSEFNTEDSEALIQRNILYKSDVRNKILEDAAVFEKEEEEKRRRTFANRQLQRDQIRRIEDRAISQYVPPKEKSAMGPAPYPVEGFLGWNSGSSAKQNDILTLLLLIIIVYLYINMHSMSNSLQQLMIQNALNAAKDQ